MLLRPPHPPAEAAHPRNPPQLYGISGTATFSNTTANPVIGICDPGVWSSTGTVFEAVSLSFGTITQTGSFQDRALAVSNSGHATLSISGSPTVRLSGASEFSITVKPAASILAGGTPASFTICHKPTASGIHTATAIITSNDSLTPTSTFTVTGCASLPVASAEPTYFYYMNGSTMMVWQRSGNVWTERYPNGSTNTYVSNAKGHTARNRANSAGEVFIPDVNEAQRAFGLWFKRTGYNNNAFWFVGTMYSVR